MGWFKDSLDKLKELPSAEPIECPRGWEKVSFVVDLEWSFVFFPVFELSRRCPIGGGRSCTDCEYPFKPEDAERLRENLSKLDALREEDVLSETECAVRRQMVINLQAGNLQDGTGGSPGEGFRTAAWVLGLPGLVLTAVGYWLADTLDPRFWAMAISGAVIVALSMSFAIVAWTKREPKADSSSTSRRELEARHGS